LTIYRYSYTNDSPDIRCILYNVVAATPSYLYLNPYWILNKDDIGRVIKHRDNLVLFLFSDDTNKAIKLFNIRKEE
jgi:hypothetical protein